MTDKLFSIEEIEKLIDQGIDNGTGDKLAQQLADTMKKNEQLRKILTESICMLDTIAKCVSHDCEDCREYAAIHRDEGLKVLGRRNKDSGDTCNICKKSFSWTGMSICDACITKINAKHAGHLTQSYKNSLPTICIGCGALLKNHYDSCACVVSTKTSEKVPSFETESDSITGAGGYLFVDGRSVTKEEFDAITAPNVYTTDPKTGKTKKAKTKFVIEEY